MFPRMVSIPLFLISLFIGGTESISLKKEMVDLTTTLDNSAISYPLNLPYRMRIIQKGITPEGYWLQLENIKSSSHMGTHIDAPSHFAKGAASIDDIPLSKLVVEAAVVDITEKAAIDPDAYLEIEDLLTWERQTGRKLNDVIVVLRSNWDKRYPDPKRFLGTTTNDATRLHFPGLSPRAARWLVDKRNIIAFGTDTASVDYGPSQLYHSHRILLSNNIYCVEFLANLDKLPICGAKFHIMPIKLRGASGAPCRVYATFPKSSICGTFDKKFMESASVVE